MQRRWWIVALATAVLGPPLAHAGERIALSNGFELRCDHHAASGDRVRVFLSAGEDNYLDFQAAAIASVETVPDPPPAETAAKPPESAARPADAELSQVDVAEMLGRASRRHHLDVDLLASVIKAESGGNSRARSRAGAEGLMQLMPATAADLGVSDRMEPEQNVQGGSAYLDALLARYHENLALALAAYNAGPAAVDKYKGIPPYAETRTYVARVIHEFNRRVLKREAAARRHAAASRATPR